MSNTQSTAGGVPKTLFDVIQQAKAAQSMADSDAPKTIFDVIQQAKAAKADNKSSAKTQPKTRWKTASLKTSAIIEAQTDQVTLPKSSSKTLWKTGLKKASLAEKVHESPHIASKIHWKENLEESDEQTDGVISAPEWSIFAPEKLTPKARWKKALNMIAVEKWKAKLEEIEMSAVAKSSEQLEIATNLQRKTTLVVSVIA